MTRTGSHHRWRVGVHAFLFPVIFTPGIQSTGHDCRFLKVLRRACGHEHQPWSRWRSLPSGTLLLTFWICFYVLPSLSCPTVLCYIFRLKVCKHSAGSSFLPSPDVLFPPIRLPILNCGPFSLEANGRSGCSFCECQASLVLRPLGILVHC